MIPPYGGGEPPPGPPAAPRSPTQDPNPEITMRLELKSRDVPMTRSLVEQAERRLRFALHLFGDQVRRVRVHLSGAGGGAGVGDYRCRIQAQLEPGGVVQIEERRRDPVSALALASEQIGRRVAARLGGAFPRRPRGGA